MARIPGDQIEEWKRELDDPLPGSEVVTEQMLEQEGQGFMDVLALTGG